MSKKSDGPKKPRTPAQKEATRKMIAALIAKGGARTAGKAAGKTKAKAKPKGPARSRSGRKSSGSVETKPKRKSPTARLAARVSKLERTVAAHGESISAMDAQIRSHSSVLSGISGAYNVRRGNAQPEAN